jgi:hypothetical protein
MVLAYQIVQVTSHGLNSNKHCWYTILPCSLYQQQQCNCTSSENIEGKNYLEWTDKIHFCFPAYYYSTLISKTLKVLLKLKWPHALYSWLVSTRTESQAKHGHTMVTGFSPQGPVFKQSSPRRICSGQSGTEIVQVLQFSPISVNPIMVHNHSPTIDTT